MNNVQSLLSFCLATCKKCNMDIQLSPPAKDLADLLISFFQNLDFCLGRIVLKKLRAARKRREGYAHAVNRLYATIGIKHIIALLREMFQILEIILREKLNGSILFA